MGNKPSTNKPNLTFKKIRSELTSKLRKTTDKPDVLRVREKYSHFRILVIGRANAGKTTLLKRVCNTLDDPIYDEENKNLVRLLSSPKIQTHLTTCNTNSWSRPQE